jgi:hypothetical protein
MNEKKQFSTYSVIPTEIMLSKEISSTGKILYGIISSLTNEKGYCWASNDYLGRLLNISGTRISLLIKELTDFEYIESLIENNYKRKIKLKGALTKVKGGYKEKLKGALTKVKDNNIIEYYNNNSEPSSQDFTNKVINEFYEFNKQVNYSSKTERKAVQELAKQYGQEELIKMIKHYRYLLEVDTFMPVATTPFEFKKKLAKILIRFKNLNK